MLLKIDETASVPYEELVGKEVLIVDDDQMLCESMDFMLFEMGINCECVLSGEEAVKRVEERHKSGKDYFAVFVDWKMPEMDGVAVIRKIRSKVGYEIPIVIISAYDWSEIEAEATEAGVNDFIGKPPFKSRLARVFDKILGKDAVQDTVGLNELTKQADFSTKRVLLAEDNEINAEIAIEVLGMTGVSVDWVKNGKEALDNFEASSIGGYDCIFMDVQMPIMNGLDAARAIRNSKRDDAKSVPIIAMTANAFADDVQATLNAGMNEHIAKPLDFDLLIKMLNKYLG